MKIRIFFILFVSLVLSACGSDNFSIVKAEPLVAGAEKIRIIKTDPQNCEYLGEVIGSQGNFFTGTWTSNQSLEQGARNEMKNKALKIGADTVVIITDRQGQNNNFQTSTITYTGNAYRCK